MSVPTAPTILAPTDLRSAREAVLDSTGRIAICGAGTAAGWAGRLAPVDAVLDTTGLRGVIDHNPGDMTVSVRAGTPVLDLAAELGPHGQRLAVDAARVACGATVGGLIATADSGPAALVHGSMRDLVIGATMLLSDGTIARSGGHVIKNVAGYDLVKVLHGSHGTLAVLVEVVLRLHPVPGATATVAVDCTLAEAARLAVTVLASPVEPVALEWISPGTLLVRLEGTAGALDARVERLVGLIGGRGAESWDRHAELTRGRPDDAVVRIGVRPDRLPGLISALSVSAATVGLGTGIATLTVPVDAVESVHDAVGAVGGTSMLRDRPGGTSARAWGSAPSALSVLTALKHNLDPDDRFGPGRFAPWL